MNTVIWPWHSVEYVSSRKNKSVKVFKYRSKFCKKKWLCLFLVLSWSQMAGKYCCCCQRAHFSSRKVTPLPGVCWIHISLSRQLNMTRIVSTSILCQEQSHATVCINNSPECLFYHRFGQQSSLYWSLVVPLETPDNNNKTEQRSNTKCTAKMFRISKIRF